MYEAIQKLDEKFELLQARVTHIQEDQIHVEEDQSEVKALTPTPPTPEPIVLPTENPKNLYKMFIKVFKRFHEV